jgi:hypothetical protein
MLKPSLRGVLAKLLFFSISLGVAPLSSYYVSLKYVYEGMFSSLGCFLLSLDSLSKIGNSTVAAIVAVVAANAVLIAYIVTSLLEDRKDNTKKAEPESKKTR